MNPAPNRTDSPVIRRSSPKQAAQNSALILKALEREAIVVGLDQISVRAVAKRAGLTTGAIYGRYENVDEMLVALWTESVSQPFGDAFIQSIAAFTDRSTPSFPRDIAGLLNRPTSIMRLGAEFIVIAQRNEVVGEVVKPLVSSWLHDAGLNINNSEIDRAVVAIAASMLVGASLRSFITGKNEYLGAVAAGIHTAYLSAVPQQKTQHRHNPTPIRSATGNPLRDALIDATADVMSKTGFNGATISRIARRSSITSGSLYNFYGDKEALMNDAVYELMRATQNQNLEAKRTAAQLHQENFGLTDSFDFGLIPDRVTWVRFRQECIIAARHHKTTHRTMNKVLNEIETQMLETFSSIDPVIVKLVNVGEQAIGYGYCSLMTFTDLFPTCNFDAIMIQIAKQNGL